MIFPKHILTWFKIARDWYGENEYTNWIVKHGCRTLLKKGNKEVLDIFGFSDADCVNVDGFTLGTSSISIGEDMTFSFTILATDTTKIRLEYEIDYARLNGKHSRKIFQISEILLKANQEKTYTKTHPFKDLSSRKHYPRTHSITLIVNGTPWETLNFEVLAAK